MKNTLRRIGGLYKILCAGNSKVYIGQTKNFGRRFGEHRSALERGAHRNPDLQTDYNKYGREAFEYSVIEISDCNLDQKERLLIQEARSLGLCYNVFDGGHKGASPSKEWRRKVSEKNSGKVVSAEQRQKASASASRQWENQRYRNLMIDSARKQWLDDGYREKMLRVHSGKGNPSVSKLTVSAVRELRALYSHDRSVRDLANAYGVSECTIRSANQQAHLETC